MNQLKIISFFIITILSFGCIREDLSMCPPPSDANLNLNFVNINQQDDNFFTEKIKCVDVFIFDHLGEFVKRQHVNHNDMLFFKGAKIKLNPGIYRIICWGNAMKNTAFANIYPGNCTNDAFLNISKLINTAPINSNEKLYYAPHQFNGLTSTSFMVTIPNEGKTEANLSFRCAHFKIQTFIQGFTDKSSQNEPLLPMVEIVNVPTNYNFDLDTFGEMASIRKSSDLATIDGKEYAISEHYTPFLLNGSLSKVVIRKQSNNEIVSEINIKEFIIQNNIQFDCTEEVVIPIKIEFLQSSIQITLPGWGNTPITPEL